MAARKRSVNITNKNEVSNSNLENGNEKCEHNKTDDSTKMKLRNRETIGPKLLSATVVWS